MQYELGICLPISFLLDQRKILRGDSSEIALKQMEITNNCTPPSHFHPFVLGTQTSVPLIANSQR